MTSSTTDAFDALFQPFGGLAAFRDDYWPGRFVAVDGALDRLSVLTGGQKVETVEDVIKLYDNPVMVVGEAVIDASGGIIDRMLVDRDEAMDWYDRGAALEFDFAHQFIPALARLVGRAREEFRLPPGALAKGIIYAAKSGGGFPVHFDAYVNFVFQLGGEKVWRLQDNANVDLPIQHYDLAQYPYLPEDLTTVWRGEPPAAGLPDGRQVVLRPGSMLFLPRGLWHCTRSGEETLSMNITLGQPTWLDLLQWAVRRKLAALPEWRGLVQLDESGSFSPEVAETLGRALAAASAELGALAPADLALEWNRGLDQNQEVQGGMRQSLALRRLIG
ncbi:JmjC domain-containing protein [Micromonospora sp. NPDC000316]|uniref:JmjC domain-containing protein n=1 Tax=Micromonospora sp. NPDC000316 TaxID=3364216 RepID=UPI0036B94C56